MNERREGNLNNQDVDFLVMLIVEKQRLLRASPGLKHYRGFSPTDLILLIKKLREQLEK